MPRACARATLCLAAALALGAAERSGAEPLDPSDPAPRQIQVQVETSTDPSVVGVTYGLPVAASYSVSGGVGTVTIPVASHEQLRQLGVFFTPIPGSFTPVVIQIDLGDLGATSQTASGAYQDGPILLGFTQNPLGSDTVAGHASAENVSIFCTSQQQIDDLCPIVPAFCGATCHIVPGAPYDPATGKLNLVGSDTLQGCDGSLCYGPFTNFSKHGDLKLSEAAGAPQVPGLSAPALALLAASLLLSGRAARRATQRSA